MDNTTHRERSVISLAESQSTSTASSRSMDIRICTDDLHCDPAAPDVSAICHEIHDAFNTYGVDETKLIGALGTATPRQRASLSRRYAELYGKKLRSVIKSNSSGDFSTALKLLVVPTKVTEARLIKMAFGRLNTVEKQIYTIICGRSSEEMNDLKQAYLETYGHTLDDLVASRLKGDFQMLMAICLECLEETFDFSRHTHDKAMSDAEDIHFSSSGEFDTEKRTIFNILCSSPPEHLKAVNRSYAEKYGVDLDGLFQKEFSGTVRKAATFLVGIKLVPFETVAQLIKSACSGRGTDELMLTACMVRYQKMMSEVVQAHMHLYDERIKDLVSSKTKGSYKALLLEMIGAAEAGIGFSTISYQLKEVHTPQSIGDLSTEPDGTCSIQSDFSRLDSIAERRGSIITPSARIITYPPILYTISDEIGDETIEKCKDVYGACKGWHNADERQTEITELLGSADPEERTLMSMAFEEVYHVEMSSMVKGAFSGDFGTALKLLARPPNVADAKLIKMAFGRLSTAEKYIYPILCSRSNEEMNVLKRTYRETYGQTLNEVMSSGLKGDFQTLMVTCLDCKEEAFDARRHTYDKAVSDAEDIYIATRGKFGTNEKTIFEILCSSPPEHLKAVNRTYAEVYSLNLYNVCNELLSKTTRKAATFLVGMKLAPFETIAQLIKSSCSGVGVDELMLTACLVRYQLAMDGVMQAHLELFEKSMRDMIASKTKGNYKALLLRVIDAVSARQSDSRRFQPQYIQTVRVNIPPAAQPGDRLLVLIGDDSNKTQEVAIPKRHKWLSDSENDGVMFFVEHITADIGAVIAL